MFVFLQNLRATLIPTIAVPVVLLGTFGVLAITGYSINTLTMFAMVLAIGLLVDDAIVVVENVERVMSEEKLSPLEATRNRWVKSPVRWWASHSCFGRVHPDGFLRRFDRRDLPPVLRHHRLGHAPLRARRHRADACALRHHAEAAAQGRAPRPRRAAPRAQGLVRPLLRLVQPRFDQTADALPGHRRDDPPRQAQPCCCLRADRAWPWPCCSRACRRPSCRTRTRASVTSVTLPVGATQTRACSRCSTRSRTTSSTSSRTSSA
jgi:hypothetical protein